MAEMRGQTALVLKMLALAWVCRIIKEPGPLGFPVDWENGETEDTVNLRDIAPSVAMEARGN